MKTIKKIAILIILITLNSNLSAKDIVYSDCGLDTPRLVHYNHDTMQYFINDFNDSASLYINQPLKKLLKKLEITPKFFYAFGGSREKDSIRSIQIFFIDWDRYGDLAANHKLGNFYRLEVTFYQPFDAYNYDLMERQAGMQWSRVVRNYIGNRTIKQFKFYKR
jgi:hypothetical protein